jgi:hypothetical protein
MKLEEIAKTARHNHNVSDAGLAAIPYTSNKDLRLVYDRNAKTFVVSDIGNLLRIDAGKSQHYEESDPLLDVDPVSYIVDSAKHAWDLLNIAVRYGLSAAVGYESTMFVGTSLAVEPAKVRVPMVAKQPRMRVVYADFTPGDEIRERFLELSAQALGVPYNRDRAA